MAQRSLFYGEATHRKRPSERTRGDDAQTVERLSEAADDGFDVSRVESDNWYGMFVPANTPKDIVARLHGLAAEALKGPELREFVAKDGGDVVASSPQELGSHLRSEFARYAKVIKAGNIKPE